MAATIGQKPSIERRVNGLAKGAELVTEAREIQRQRAGLAGKLDRHHREYHTPLVEFRQDACPMEPCALARDIAAEPFTGFDPDEIPF